MMNEIPVSTILINKKFMEQNAFFNKPGCFGSSFGPFWRTWVNSEESAVRTLKQTKSSKFSMEQKCTI